MHPHSAHVQPDSQVMLNATINPSPQLTKGNGIDNNILYEHDDGEIEAGKEEECWDINEFASSKFPLNERCSFYIGVVPISSENFQAIEFVYMNEAESIVCSQNTLKKPELAAKLLKKYKQLIIEIPSICFGEFGLKE